MPSAKHSSTSSLKIGTTVFFPLLAIVFIVWLLYRSLFHFPVWFDEIIGKAIFFGLPVSLFISLTGAPLIRQTYNLRKIYRGLLMGVAVGGVFGFAATITTFLSRGIVVQSAPLFMSNEFWWQFFLAIMTGFWESLFFFCWVMVVIQEKFRKWSLFLQVMMVAVIFVLFHIPNTLLHTQSPLVVFNQILLLLIFAIGQALLFSRTKNVYALTLSHAIWGMVLLVHLAAP